MALVMTSTSEEDHSMPIYEYVCTKCGAETEALQKFDDSPLTQCEVCNKRGLERKLSLSAFHLQGGGWFREGYGAGNDKSTKKGTEAAKDSGSTTAAADTSPPAPAAATA
jgi:putative FmdB family regulatory protein